MGGTLTVLREADRFRVHNLIGGLVFQHAVLVDTGFVGESIRTHNGFVGLNHLVEVGGWVGGWVRGWVNGLRG